MCASVKCNFMVVCGLYNPVILNLQIRQNDRLAVSKLVTSLTRGTVRSPLAQCLLIRYTSQVYICSLMFFNVWISSPPPPPTPQSLSNIPCAGYPWVRQHTNRGPSFLWFSWGLPAPQGWNGDFWGCQSNHRAQWCHKSRIDSSNYCSSTLFKLFQACVEICCCPHFEQGLLFFSAAINYSSALWSIFSLFLMPLLVTWIPKKKKGKKVAALGGMLFSCVILW